MSPTIGTQWMELTARVEPAVLEPGTTGRLVVEAIMPQGGHIEAHEPAEPFLIPTILDLAAEHGLAAGRVEYPEAETRRFDWSPVELKVLSGAVRFEAPIEVSGTATPGSRTISATLRYQACIGGACLPPNAQTIRAEAYIGG